MKNLLFIGDAACPSGFARATHEILDRLSFHYHVTVLGINYRGDPHEFHYPIYAAGAGGDSFGLKRLVWMCDLVKPDVIIIQNDGWNIQPYIKYLQMKTSNYDGCYADIPIVAIVAVDGQNFRGEWLDGVSHAIFWTQFGLDEARTGGYSGPATVIPLGVDAEQFYPGDKKAARVAQGIGSLADKFIVGNVNRNQPRKRWDLTLRYFSKWIHKHHVEDAYLYLHVAPTGDQGIEVKQLAQYYGILNKIALMEPPTWYGISEDEMRDTYNCFDVQISTTQGEGFGLTTFEGMACGVPQIVPDWSALGDLCKGAALLVPCTTTNSGSPYVNVIGGVADEAQFIEELDAVYRDAGLRAHVAQTGLDRAAELRFTWDDIGRQYEKVLGAVLAPITVSGPRLIPAVVVQDSPGAADSPGLVVPPSPGTTPPVGPAMESSAATGVGV